MENGTGVSQTNGRSDEEEVRRARRANLKDLNVNEVGKGAHGYTLH